MRANPFRSARACARTKLGLVLVLCMAPACAHNGPRERTSVSTVTNREVTQDVDEPSKHRMHYVLVDEDEALNRDEASRKAARDEAKTLARTDDGPTKSEDARAAKEADSQACEDTVTFDSNSTALSADAKKKLAVLADCMKRNEVEHAKVVGKTDPVGTPKENLRLGKARALVVADYLKQQGVKDADLRVQSLGESEASQNSSAWPRERQAEVETSE